MPYTLQAIQKLIGGTLDGDASARISGVNTVEGAQPGDIAFAEHERYLPMALRTRASALIVTQEFPAVAGKNVLRVANPRLAFTKLMKMFEPPPSVPPGVHPSAVVSPEAVLGPEVRVGECAVIRRQARIGRGTVLDSGVHVGAEVVIGEDCRIGPNAVLMDGVRLGNRVIIHGGSVIGGDGFGYVWNEGRHEKIPQLGSVTIEDDVELGCNVCVDRATMASTIIRRGTKIDNLVQIAHNDVIGQDVSMSGQVGLSGSVTVGDRVIVGGQAGVIDHVAIGDDARIGGGTAVTRDIKPGEVVWGFPSRPLPRVKRELASLAQLPRLIKQHRELRAQVDELKSRLRALEGARSDMA